MGTKLIGRFLLGTAVVAMAACGGGSKSSGDNTTTPGTTHVTGGPSSSPSDDSTALGDQSNPDTSASAQGQSPDDRIGDRQPVGGTVTGAGMTGTTTGGTGMSSSTDPTAAKSGMTGATTGATTGSTSTTASAQTQMTITEPGIFAVVSTANQHEIDVSKLALQKSKNPKVKKLAKMMVEDHGKLQKQGDKLAKKMNVTPEDNDLAQSLRDESRTLMQRLEGLDGKDFDRAYAEAMVSDHQKVLATIDNQLLPAANDPQVKQMLEGARPVIQKHLEHSQHLQEEVSSGQ